MSKSEEDFIATLTEIEDSCRKDGKWDLELTVLKLNKMVESGRLRERESEQVIRYVKNSKPRIQGKWRKIRCLFSVALFFLLTLVLVVFVSLLGVKYLITPFVAILIVLGVALVSFVISHVVIESRLNN